MKRAGVEYFPLGLAAAFTAVRLEVAGPLLWGVSLAWAGLFLMLFRNRSFGTLTRLVLALALATGLAAVFANARSDYLYSRAVPIPLGEYLDLYGRLIAFPRIESTETILLVSVDRVDFRRRRLRVNLRIQLRVNGDLRRLNRGDRVIAGVRVYPAPDGFMARGIHFIGRSKSSMQIRRIRRGRWVWSLIGGWRNRLRRRLERFFSDGRGGPDDSGALLEALLLGDRGRISANLRETLLRAGVFHLIAISGAHIGILILIILGVSGILKRPGRLRFAGAMAGLLAYLALADFPVSAVRAGVMAGIMFLGKAMDHSPDALRSLSLTGLFLMAAVPLTCMGPGFVLTFSLAAAILVGRGLADTLPGRLPRPVREGFSAGLNAGCISLPLTLLFFQRFALAGPVAGMLLLPLCVPVLFLAILMAGCCLIWPGAVNLLLSVLGFIVNVLLHGIHLAAGLDSVILRPSPGIPVVMLTGLLFVAVHRISPGRIRRGAVLLLLVVLAAQIWPYPPRRPTRMEVHFLDVGQGDCACVVFPGGDGLLIDGGGSRNPAVHVGLRVVLPYLLRRRIRIRWMSVSHFHPDHAAGVVELIPLLRPEEVWISSAPRGDPLLKRLENLKEKGMNLRLVTAGSVISPGECGIKCLYPHVVHSSPGVRNDDSQVLMATDGRLGFLFTGDAGKAVEARLKFGNHGVAVVLKVGHHGSGTSTGKALLAAVSPGLAVISCGAGNPFGFPNAGVLRNLRDREIPWLCTAWSGSVEVCREGPGIRVSLDGDPPRRLDF